MRDHLKQYIDSSSSAEVRGLRILLEYSYASDVFSQIENKDIKIVSVFGSARCSEASPLYQLAHKVGELLYKDGFAVLTGASQGVMEAANRGMASAIAAEVSKKKKIDLKKAFNSEEYLKKLADFSAGLKISLPMEPDQNPYIGRSASFHYFMIRKFFFMNLSSGFIACEGGWGTRDEFFEMLTMVQTGKAPVLPIIYLSHDPDHMIRDLQYAVDQQLVSNDEMRLVDIVTKPEEALDILNRFYRVVDRIEYLRKGCVRVCLKKTLSPQAQKEVEKQIRSTVKHLESLTWKDNVLEMTRYLPKSYGHFRSVLDRINED